MTESCRVAIVGGGIFGGAIAWSLARRGVTDVRVLERRELAAATTSRAAALLTRVRTKASQTELTSATLRAIIELESERSESLDVSRVGSMHVAASDESEAAIRALATAAEACGEPVEWLDPSDATTRAPWLDASAARRIAFMPDDAFIDPYRLAMAFHRAAAARSVGVRTGVEVTGLLREGDRITGVELGDEGPLHAEFVVDAAGPWAGRLAREAGFDLPMAPVRSHYWITAPDERFPKDSPFVVLPDAHAYARPEVGGLLFGLRDRESLAIDPRRVPADLSRVSFGADPDGWAVLEDRGPGFARFFPGFEDVELAHYIQGPSTYTPDGQLVLGRLPGVDGFLVASGCCGAGIAMSGGVGESIAELIVGAPPTIDLAPFDPARFGAIDAYDPAWLRRCAASRSTKTSG